LVSATANLTPEEHQRIHDAVAEIERRSATRIAVVVTHVSDRYALYPPLWAGIGALAITGLVALQWPELGIRYAISIQVPALIALTLLLDWLPIRLWIAPKRVKHAHARQLAHREFAVRIAGAPHVRHLLLFVSRAERYVEILADHETHALAPEGTWDKIVGDFVNVVKAGRLAGGILAAVQACGAVLAEHHPPVDQTRN
jgi:putative membrane protein